MTTLRVGVACPDPPFNGMPDGGLDIDLMSRIAAALGMAVDFVHYEDADCGGSFNGIFDELGGGRFDCVAAGHHRDARAGASGGLRAAVPDLRAGAGRRHGPVAQGQIGRRPRRTHRRCAAGQHQPAGGAQPRRPGQGGRGPGVRLRQHPGRTHRPERRRLRRGDEVAPVLTELVKPLPGVEVVQRGITTEPIAIAVAPADRELLGRIAVAQTDLEGDGTLQQIRRRWLGNPFTDQSLTIH